MQISCTRGKHVQRFLFLIRLNLKYQTTEKREQVSRYIRKFSLYFKISNCLLAHVFLTFLRINEIENTRIIRYEDLLCRRNAGQYKLNKF